MKVFKALLTGIFAVSICMAQGGNGGETVTDADGNVYHTIKIGNQVWTVENLKTTKYNDGTAIPLVTEGSKWKDRSEPAYCWYDNDSGNKEKYGALYNLHAVNTGRLAPAGWHVPTDAEWDTLQNYLIANGYNYDGTTTGNKIAKSLAAKTDWQTYKATSKATSSKAAATQTASRPSGHWQDIAGAEIWVTDHPSQTQMCANATVITRAEFKRRTKSISYISLHDDYYMINGECFQVIEDYYKSSSTQDPTRLPMFDMGVKASDDYYKSSSTQDPQEPATTGEVGNNLTTNNSSGFSALPGGYRGYSGTFYGQSDDGHWWSATEYDASSAWYRYLNCSTILFDYDNLRRNYNYKSCGFSVRLVRD